MVYTEIMEHKRIIEIEFRPKFENLHHEIHHRVTQKKFRDLKDRCDDVEDKAQHNQGRLDRLEEQQDALKLKVEDLKVRAPAGRRTVGADRGGTKETPKPQLPEQEQATIL